MTRVLGYGNRIQSIKPNHICTLTRHGRAVCAHKDLRQQGPQRISSCGCVHLVTHQVDVGVHHQEREQRGGWSRWRWAVTIH